MLAAAALTAAGAVVALTAGPARPPSGRPRAAPNPRYALAMFTHRRPRLASLGYLGHMWELYALWTWLPMFVVAGRGARGDTAAGPTGFIAFGAIGVAGIIGCLLGGWASDRFGRPPAAVAALVISGTCCVASPLFFAAPTVCSRASSLGVGCRRHRRLRRLLHRAERDDGHPVPRHRPDRADRHRIPADRCHHPTRSCRRRPDRLAIRIPVSCTRPPARCRSDVGPTPLVNTTEFQEERHDHQLTRVRRRSSVRQRSSHALSVTTTSPCSPRSAATATRCTTTKPRPRRPGSGKSSSRAESPAPS